MSEREHDHEPIPGLPERPPRGERLLWQGAPHWTTVARYVFHVRKVAVYFAVLVLARVGWVLGSGGSVVDAGAALMLPLVAASAALGLLVLLAWLTARVTLYTITSERIVMRFGVSFQMTVNLPFSVIASAALKRHSDGTGDIALKLVDDERVSYVVMWPNVRPWTAGDAQPMLRGIPDAERVARLLSAALAGEPVNAAEDTLYPEARERETGNAGRPPALTA